jgi:hypothetical protein
MQQAEQAAQEQAEQAAQQQAEQAAQEQAVMLNRQMQQSNRNTGYFDV